MSSTDETIFYLRKLQKLFVSKTLIPFFKFSIVKKQVIDDLLCCYLVTLPIKYKLALLDTRYSHSLRLHSIISYTEFIGLFNQKKFFKKSYLFIEKKKAIKLVTTMINSIENDIKFIENYDLN